MKNKIIFIFVIVLMSIPSYASENVKERVLTNKFETEHFIFYFEEDKEKLNDVFDILEQNYERILIAFDVQLSKKVKVEIYPSLNDYHLAVYGKKAKDWMVGHCDTKEKKLMMVSPNNPGNEHNFNSVIKVAVHEFVHYITMYKTDDIFKLPNWLREGVAMYFAEQMNEDGKNNLRELINNNNIPRISQLEGRVFPKRGGYLLSYTIIEYIVKNHGQKMLLKFIKEPKAYKDVFSCTKKEFNKRWQQYLIEEYK